MNIRVKFRKYGPMKFIGHLDMMRYFQKAIRRAGIDIAYSGGYSPHQIMSFAAPLGVGATSGGEYFDIEARSTRSSIDSIEALNRVMASGVDILEYKKLPDAARPAMSLVAAADYFVYGKGLNGLLPYLDGFYAGQGQIHVTKQTKRKETELDLKPLIYRMEPVSLGEEAEERRFSDGKADAIAPGMREYPRMLFLRVSAGSSDNVKPELALEAFCHFCGVEYEPLSFSIHRLEVYAKAGEIPVKGERERAEYQAQLDRRRESCEREGKPFPQFVTLGELGEDIA